MHESAQFFWTRSRVLPQGVKTSTFLFFKLMRIHSSLLAPRYWVIPLFLALCSVPALAAEKVSSRLLGLWVVQDSACKGCDPAKGAETGAVLRISEQGIQDPFSNDCHGAVQSREIGSEPFTEFQARMGVPARWLVAQSTPEQNKVTTFEMVCGDKTVLKVFALPNGDLLRPAEASTVLRFRHP